MIEIPAECYTTAVFKCVTHDVELKGTPGFTRNLGGWAIDLSDMYCPKLDELLCHTVDAVSCETKEVSDPWRMYVRAMSPVKS